MSLRTLMFAVTIGLFALLNRAPLQAQSIQWRTSYAAALQEASQKNRPLFVDFYTHSCYWCVRLDTGTFADPGVVKLVNEHFVPLKLEASQLPHVTQALQVQRFPTLVFAAPNGTILMRREGFEEASLFLVRLQQVLAESAKSVAAAGQAASQ